MKWGFIGLAVILGVCGVILIMILKREHDAERAAETERILSTPLRDGARSDAEEDELLRQYGSDDGDG